MRGAKPLCLTRPLPSVFTEAVVHGSQRWVGAGSRRALLYKYSPGFAMEPGSYPALRETAPLLPLARTPIERFLLRPPGETGEPKPPLPPPARL